MIVECELNWVVCVYGTLKGEWRQISTSTNVASGSGEQWHTKRAICWRSEQAAVP